MAAPHLLRLPHATQKAAERHTLQCVRSLQEVTVCSQCARYIKGIPYIFVNDSSLCIGCYSKTLPPTAIYSVIQVNKHMDLSSRLTLYDYLKILSAAEKLGIDSLQLMQQHLHNQYSRADIKQMIEDILQEHNNLNSGQLQANQLQQQQLVRDKCRHDKHLERGDYQLSDYLLASLHEHSHPDAVELFISYKMHENRVSAEIDNTMQQIGQKNMHSKNQLQYIYNLVRQDNQKQQKISNGKSKQEEQLHRAEQEIAILQELQQLRQSSSYLLSEHQILKKEQLPTKTCKKIKRTVPRLKQSKRKHSST